MVLDFVDNEPWFLDAFKFGKCVDEIVFQTLISHLGRRVVGACPTKTFWDGGPNPKDIDMDLLQQALSGWHLFGRKFSFEKNPNVRDALEV